MQASDERAWSVLLVTAGFIAGLLAARVLAWFETDASSKLKADVPLELAEAEARVAQLTEAIANPSKAVATLSDTREESPMKRVSSLPKEAAVHAAPKPSRQQT